jgi:hypothetical protein
MPLQPRDVLLGGATPRRRYVALALPAVLFVLTFTAYALDVFQVSGGVVFLAAHAALVGMVGAAWVGYHRAGLVVAWVTTYAALLGQSADHYFLGQSPSHSLTDRAAAFLQPDGLVFLGVEALVLGTLAFLFGVLCDRGRSLVAAGALSPDRN